MQPSNFPPTVLGTDETAFCAVVAGVFFCLFVLCINGCSPLTGIRQGPGSETPADPFSDEQSDTFDTGSGSLTKTGFEQLKQKNYSGAIRILERAVSINPYDGAAYYYLAEAWIKKKNYRLALKFNRLAGLHLDKSPAWQSMAEKQKDIILTYDPEHH